MEGTRHLSPPSIRRTLFTPSTLIRDAFSNGRKTIFIVGKMLSLPSLKTGPCVSEAASFLASKGNYVPPSAPSF